MPYVLTPGLVIRSPVQPGRGTVIGYLNKTLKVAENKLTTKDLLFISVNISALKKGIFFENTHLTDWSASQPASHWLSPSSKAAVSCSGVAMAAPAELHAATAPGKSRV